MPLPDSPEPAAVAILLCAGYGTRMGKLTSACPKALLPLAGRPLLDHLMVQIKTLPEISAVHLVSNSRHLSQFQDWAAAWSRPLASRSMTLQVHDDGTRSAEKRLGAVGDLAFVLDHIEPPVGALVAAGDNVFRFSLEPFWRAFLEGEENLVLALPEADPARLRRTGVLELGADDRVDRLHEKPAEPPSSWVAPALYALTPAALERVDEYLEAGHAGDELGRFIDYLTGREPVRALKVDGRRLHIGTPEGYRQADAVLRGEAAD